MKKELKLTGKFHKGIFALYVAYCNWGGETKFGNFDKKSKAYFVVKKYLLNNKTIAPTELTKLFEQGHPANFVVRVLRYDQDFNLGKEKCNFEKPDKWYGNFDVLIKNFYVTNKIDKLTKTCQVFYNKQISRYLPTSKRIISNTNKFLRINPIDLGLNQVILLPNQIDRTLNGYGVRISNTCYVVFGDSLHSRLKKGLIQHEYLHGIINPEFEKTNIKKLVKETECLYDQFISSSIKKHYSEWSHVLIEYIIRSITCWTAHPTKQEKCFIEDELQNGFIKIRYFNRYRESYLKSTKNFIEYIPELLMSLKKIAKRINLLAMSQQTLD